MGRGGRPYLELSLRASRPACYTKLIVAGADYVLLQDTLVMAKLLQPSLVVLEDVDLIGSHRDGPFAAGKVLNLLLNEMDGLARDARVLFVLTTNRPEVLEPALACSGREAGSGLPPARLGKL